MLDLLIELRIALAALEAVAEPRSIEGRARKMPTPGAPCAPHPAPTVAAMLPATDPETKETLIVPVWALPTDQPTE
jgi:hypothetical protein